MRRRKVEYIECFNCKSRLDIATYSAYPTEDTPKHLIKKHQDPNMPYLSVQCPNCGFYSVSTPWAPWEPE